MPSGDSLKTLASEAGFTVTSGEDVTSLYLEGLPISVKVVEATDDKVFLLLACRTLSWDWSGERTDLNDVVSHLSAAFLRNLAHVSARFILIPNPAADLKPEIYARYLLFDQPNESSYDLDDEGLERLRRTLMALHALRSYLPHPHPVEVEPAGSYDCPWMPIERQQHPYIYLDSNDSWRLQMMHAIDNQFVVGEAIANRRHDPDWLYFRTGPGTLSIVESDTLAHLFRALATNDEATQSVPAIAGKLLLTGDLRNYVSNRLSKKVQFIFRRLQGRQRQADFVTIPLENSLIFAGDRHSLFVGTQSGKLEFDRERARLAERHEKEAQVLFPVAGFVWADSIPDERFELMIRELLAIEPAVTWVRAAGHTRDRDQGRDLLADWLIPVKNPDEISVEKPPVRIGRVVVQCKALNRSVGKRDVPDIYDTIRAHHADGYVLAVALRPTAALVTFLDGLRQEREVFIDWWGRQEIEDRLGRSPATLAKFPDLVQATSRRRHDEGD